MSSFQGVRIEEFTVVLISGGWNKESSTVYRGVFISGGWNREVSLWLNSILQDVVSRGRVPLVVGGTGLYIQTLLREGVSGSPPSTEESRAMVNQIISKEDGNDWKKR